MKSNLRAHDELQPRPETSDIARYRMKNHINRESVRSSHASRFQMFPDIWNKENTRPRQSITIKKTAGNFARVENVEQNCLNDIHLSKHLANRDKNASNFQNWNALHSALHENHIDIIRRSTYYSHKSLSDLGQPRTSDA